MPIYSFHCNNCTTTVIKNSAPNTANCSKGIYHKWTKLGEIGEKYFHCKNCGTTIKSKNKTYTAGCTKASYHNWTQL